MQELKKKIGLWLLKDSLRYPTVDEIVTITPDKTGILLGDRNVDKTSVQAFGHALEQLTKNEAFPVLINTILFKWQSNILNNGNKESVNTIRQVNHVVDDLEKVLVDVYTAYKVSAQNLEQIKKQIREKEAE